MDQESETILAIAKRAEALYARLDLTMPTDRMGLVMDIDYCHKLCPLDLAAWLRSDDANFAHDLGGIVKFWDRTTLSLTNGFVPRHAYDQVAA